MNQSIDAIRNHLLSGLAGSSIEYQNSSGCHKFRIESSDSTHWLYVSHNIVDDSEPAILII